MSFLRRRGAKALLIAGFCLTIALTVVLTLVIRRAIYREARFNDCFHEIYFARLWDPAQALQVREQAQGTVYTFASGARVTVFTLEDGTEALLYENPNNGCRKLYYNHVLAELGVGEFYDGLYLRYETYRLRDSAECARIYAAYGQDDTPRLEDGYVIFTTANGEVFID